MEKTFFSTARFEVLQEMAKGHFWYAGRRAMLRNMLDSQPDFPAPLAVDIGCGPGAHLADWRDYAARVIGLDQYAPADMPQDAQITRLVGQVDDLPIEDASVDLAIMLDVLEHVPEEPSLNEVMRVLRPGGVLLLSVPTFNWLWSFRDVDAGHMRRYSKRQLHRAIEASGLQIARTRYYQFFLFPLVIVTRKLGRESQGLRDREDQPGGLVNRIFRAINLAEAWLDRKGVVFPIGSSLLLVARKP